MAFGGNCINSSEGNAAINKTAKPTDNIRGCVALTRIYHDPDIRVGASDVGGDSVGCVKVPAPSRVGRAHERRIGRALKQNKDLSELSLCGLRPDRSRQEADLNESAGAVHAAQANHPRRWVCCEHGLDVVGVRINEGGAAPAWLRGPLLQNGVRACGRARPHRLAWYTQQPTVMLPEPGQKDRRAQNEMTEKRSVLHFLSHRERCGCRTGS